MRNFKNKLYNYIENFKNKFNTIYSKNIIHLLYWIVLVFLSVNLITTKRELKLNKNISTSLINENKIWKDVNNSLHAKQEIIETKTTKEFITLKGVNKNIEDLQKEVKNFQKNLKEKGSVSIITNIVSVDTVFKSTIIYKDTIITKDTLKIFPEYRKKFNLENYVYGNVISNKDSINISLKVKNDYSIILGEEKKGLFKKKIPFAEVINKNPYSDLISLKTYQVSSYKKKFISIGPVVGGGFVDNWKFKPFIGVGISYNLISF